MPTLTRTTLRQARTIDAPCGRPPTAIKVLLLGQLVLGSHAGAAPGLSPRNVADMSLEALLRVPVSVASLAAESFVDAPSSVTVFTRPEIRALGVRTIEELLNFVPGMRSVRTASRSAYAVGARGRNSAQLSNDILFLVNGQRLNDDFSGAALLFNRFLATGNVQQVEVIRGPGSALYGSNAFLGVVNIVTAVDLNEAYVGAASHDGLEGSVAVSGGDERYHASLFLSGARDSGEDYTDPTSPAGNTISDPRRAFTAYATLETAALRVDARHAQFTADEFYVFRVTPGNAVNEYSAQDSSVALSYALLDADDQQLKLSGGWRRIDNEGLGQPPVPTRAAQPFLGGPVVRLTEYHAALDGSRQFGQRHHLFGGLEYRSTKFDKLVNQSNYGLPPTVYYGGVIETLPFGPQGESRDILGAYLQDKIRLTEELRATLGVRFDHYSDFGSAISPRAALVYRVAADSTLKLMYGQAFRAPTVSELELINSPTSVGNPDLRPEKIRTLELAWLQEFGPAQLTVTGYYSRLKDQIIRVPVGGADPRLTFANGDTADLSGVELELGADLTPTLTLRAAYAHAFELVTGPQTMPRNSASLIVNHRYGQLNSNLSVVYRSAIDTGTPTPERLDESWEANLNLRYQLPGVTLLGSIYNLTDEDTGDFTQTDIPGGSPIRGRSYRLGVELPF
jgi:outer membrane receptor protein involved in Fe transport